MSYDLRRISLFGIVFLVLLRISIGWQFLYEGLWKQQTQTTANPWTAKGYLLSAQGPFRPVFRGMVDDPNGLDWLDYDKVLSRWNEWEEQFVEHYRLEELSEPAKLSPEQTQALLDQFPLTPIDAEQLLITFRIVDPDGKNYKQELDQKGAVVADAIRDLRNEETQDAAADELAKSLELNNVEEIKEATKLGTADATQMAILQKLANIQKTRLKEMLHGPDSYEVPLARWPEEVEAKWGGSLGPRITYRPGTLTITNEYQKSLFEPAERRLKPALRERMLDDFVTKEAEPEYHAAVVKLFDLISTPPYERVLESTLKEDPDWTGQVLDKEGNIVETRANLAELYETRLEKYESDLAMADRDTKFEHLKTDWQKIQELRSQVVAPIEQLDANLKSDARGMLVESQRDLGPVPSEPSQIQKIDQFTIWMLIGLGVLLIAGFFTRISALLGAGMVFSFYLVHPPWPGVPEVGGPEHSLIVNKNLIEVMALLALTFLPTGSWFGVDGIFRRLFGGKKTEQPASQSQKTEEKSASKPVAVAK